MKYLSLGIILAVVLSSSIAFAEPFIVNVPGQSWQIGVNLPLLDEYQGKVQGKRFIFLGKNSQMGFMISILGEPWTSGGNKECRSVAWSKASQNPMIEKQSIKISEMEKFSQIIYTLNTDVKGQKVKQSNADFFFVFDKYCMDVRLSKLPSSGEDEKIFTSIGNSMGWGRGR